jgi:hypothetical protein
MTLNIVPQYSPWIYSCILIEKEIKPVLHVGRVPYDGPAPLRAFFGFSGGNLVLDRRSEHLVVVLQEGLFGLYLAQCVGSLPLRGHGFRPAEAPPPVTLLICVPSRTLGFVRSLIQLFFKILSLQFNTLTSQFA